MTNKEKAIELLTLLQKVRKELNSIPQMSGYYGVDCGLRKGVDYLIIRKHAMEENSELGNAEFVEKQPATELQS